MTFRIYKHQGIYKNKLSKMATWQPYLFFDPHDNTVLAYILKIVQDRAYRKSHTKFHLARFSLTLSDLERSNR